MPLAAKEPGKRYLLSSADQHKRADEVLEDVIDEILGTHENIEVFKQYLGGRKPETREDWDTVKPFLTWRGQPLWKVGFWNLLSEVRNPETYEYVTDSFGYYSLGSNWNAAEAIQTVSMDFAGTPEYHTLRQGYSAVPDALAEKVSELGGSLELGTRLISIDAPREGPKRATLEGPTGRFTVEADKVLLGLPRRALELLAPSADFDLQSDTLKPFIDSVTPIPAFKLFLFFEERWWEELGITKGRSICDLPIRQTYYMAPESGDSESGLVMASYDDGRAVEFWQGLIPPEDEEKRRKRRKELRKELASLAEVREKDLPGLPEEVNPATPQMIRHATEQLYLLHDQNGLKIPEPKAAAYADWGFDPFGGGWNFWKPQVEVKNVMTTVKAPLGKERGVFIVGDAYSGVQGWVEGALTVTELVLENDLGLTRPSWLPADYYLGW